MESKEYYEERLAGIPLEESVRIDKKGRNYHLIFGPNEFDTMMASLGNHKGSGSNLAMDIDNLMDAKAIPYPI